MINNLYLNYDEMNCGFIKFCGYLFFQIWEKYVNRLVMVDYLVIYFNKRVDFKEWVYFE